MKYSKQIEELVEYLDVQDALNFIDCDVTNTDERISEYERNTGTSFNAAKKYVKALLENESDTDVYSLTLVDFIEHLFKKPEEKQLLGLDMHITLGNLILLHKSITRHTKSVSV